MKNGDFFRQKFEILAMCLMLAFFCAMILHFSHHPAADDKALTFALQAASGILASIITLLQTTRIAERKTDEPPDTRSVVSKTVTVEKTTEPKKEEKETDL